MNHRFQNPPPTPVILQSDQAAVGDCLTKEMTLHEIVNSGRALSAALRCHKINIDRVGMGFEGQPIP